MTLKSRKTLLRSFCTIKYRIQNSFESENVAENKKESKNIERRRKEKERKL